MKVFVACIVVFLLLLWTPFKSGSDADRKIEEMMRKKEKRNV